MKKITCLIAFLLPVLFLSASPLVPADTTFQYNNRKVVIDDSGDEMNVSVYQLNAQGDTLQSHKIYEGIFTENKSIERRYESSFDISIPDIFKPKSKRRESRAHWDGFGVGFVDLPGGELASILNNSRSLQFNLNLIEASGRLGNSPFIGITGMGIQFNSVHLQSNKAIEVQDYTSVVTTTAPGTEYNKSRLHYTYLTFPLLIETNWNIGRGSHLFLNAGIVGKVKTASSSKIWQNDQNGKKQKTKLPGDLNIRPVTFDVMAQAGINDFGVFVSYTPLSLFREGKGPKAHQATIGLQFYF